MRLARALELTHNFVSTPNSLEGLDSLLDPTLVEQALEQAGVATLRKRRLPLEMMLWCVISMAFFRRMSAWDVVSRMNIMLPGQRPLVAPSAVVQARQRLGSEAVRQVFDLMQKSWHEAAGHPTWAGLRLLGVDGVVWRTPDTPENRARYDSASNQHGETGFPQVRMVCQMELTSHLLIGSAFDGYLKASFALRQVRRQFDLVFGLLKRKNLVATYVAKKRFLLSYVRVCPSSSAICILLKLLKAVDRDKKKWQRNESIAKKPVAVSKASRHRDLCFCLISNNRAPIPFFCFKGGEVIFFGEPFELY